MIQIQQSHPLLLNDSETSCDDPVLPTPIPSKFSSKDTMTVYGVPIYNKDYFQCTQFGTGDQFDICHFAALCIEFACKTDLVVNKSMNMRRRRDGRTSQRTVRYADEVEAAFLKGCPDSQYRQLFVGCFTMDKSSMMLNGKQLRKYQTDLQKEKRKKAGTKATKPFVIYARRWGIKEETKYRLYLLLKLYYRHTTWGVIDIEERPPPWYKSDDDIISQITEGIKSVVVDLTEMESDDDEDVEMESRHNRIIPRAHD